MKIELPDIEAIDAAMEAAAAANDNWKRDYLAGVAGILNAEPRRYLGFGPYWWGLKKALKDAGHDFGPNMDADWLKNTDMGDDNRNVVAASIYEEWALDNGYTYSGAHPFNWLDEEASAESGDECWESDFYVLFDEDMEERA